MNDHLWHVPLEGTFGKLPQLTPQSRRFIRRGGSFDDILLEFMAVSSIECARIFINYDKFFNIWEQFEQW